MKIIGIVGSPR